MEPDTEALAEQAGELSRVGKIVYERGWVPATSGNFSARLSADRVCITVSGKHKGELDEGGVMVVDLDGRPQEPGKRPSAETLLHTQLYTRFPQVGAVLHTHSKNATLLSRLRGEELVLSGYELLKAFAEVDTHETSVRVPIFPNDQDIPRLAAKVEAYLDSHAAVHGYLIAGHGLYTWGATLAEALRHAEAFEFLFDCELHMHARAHQ